MRKILITILALFMMLIDVPAVKAETIDNGRFEYEMNEDGKTVSIVKGTVDTDTVFVPEGIDGYRVTVIRSEAFDCTDVVEIILPESLETIEEKAFYNCDEVLDLTIAGSTAAERGFEKLEKLKTLSILKGTGEMHDYELSFDCPWHDSFYRVTMVYLADGITHIGDNSFAGFYNVKYIKIPKSVESVGKAAFMNMNALRRLELPVGLKQAGDRAFGSDPVEVREISIVIPKNLTDIGKNAFSTSRTYYAYKDSPSAQHLIDNRIDFTEVDFSLVGDYSLRVSESKEMKFNECPDFIMKQTKFRSSDETIATVSGDGLITAYRSGMVTITAATDTAETSVTINVGRNKLTRYDTVYLRLPDDSTSNLTPRSDFAQFENYEGRITYKYIGNNVLINSAGKVTPRSKGRTMVLVLGELGQRAQYVLDVYKPVRQIEVNMDDLVMLKDRELRLKTYVYPENADDLNLEYSTDDPEIVKVDYTGLLVAENTGNTKLRIKARDGSNTGRTVDIQVNNDGVDLAIWAMPMKLGEQFKFEFDYDFKYYSSDDSIVSINENGELRALSEGECYIILYLEDKSMITFCDITVTSQALAYGIDISNWNDALSNNDWQNLKNWGIDFAIIRAGYANNYKDAKFEDYYERGRNAGMPLGVYHYTIAMNEEEAREEAEVMLGYLEGKKFEYPVVMDIEEAEQKALPNDEFNKIVDTYCSILADAGYLVAIYSNASMLNKLNEENREKYDIWMAHWNTTTPTVYKDEFTIWQFTSDGRVPGIDGRVDMNLCYFDYPDYIIQNQLNGY